MGYNVGGFVALFVVWPVGTMIRKGLDFNTAQWSSDFFAIPTLITILTWTVSDTLQDGTLACWPWVQAVTVSGAGGIALQTVNYLFPYPRGGLFS